MIGSLKITGKVVLEALPTKGSEFILYWTPCMLVCKCSKAVNEGK